MEGRVEVEYFKDGKKIQELVQDWIDENSNILLLHLTGKSFRIRK